MPSPSSGKTARVRLNGSGKLPLNRLAIRCIVLEILGTLKCSGCEVCFHFVSDAEMRSLNRKFKHRDCRTDVLAFSQVEGKRFPAVGRVLLGDVIISVDAARRQAPVFGNPLEKEFVLYLVHGILHLLGYDDIRLSSRKAMRAKENDVLKKIERKFHPWPSTRPKRSS